MLSDLGIKPPRTSMFCLLSESLPPCLRLMLSVLPCALDIFAYVLYSCLSVFVCAVASHLARRTGWLYWMSECVYTVVLMLTSLLAGEQGSDVC